MEEPPAVPSAADDPTPTRLAVDDPIDVRVLEHPSRPPRRVPPAAPAVVRARLLSVVPPVAPSSNGHGAPEPTEVDHAPRPHLVVDPEAERATSADLPPRVAPTVLSVRQRVIAIALGVALVASLALATLPTLIVVMAALVVFFMAANLMKLWLISRALDAPDSLSVDPGGERIPDEYLPTYTILLPVFHEASMLPQLVDGILSLDYPEDRLDVKLLLEEEDTETREAADAMDLPPCFDVLVVPAVGPTGKPRACNFGLAHAEGAYLVIYDAEDRPEPDQLRKSVAAFWTAARDVVCFQAQLNYFNRTHNLLTRWFTAEYSVWFDQLLPGLQAMDVVIPLGGTSNHFITSRLRLIGGWNSFNVTEDADLGLRIFLQGWKTAILETTTYEEATSRYRNWIRQRSRWVKGYMQTYLFHMRQPVRLARRMGAKSYTAFQLFFGAGTLCLLLNPIFWLLAVAWFATKLHLIQSIFPWPVLYLGTIGLFVGNVACVLSVVSGCFGRRNYEDVKYALLVPFYWILMSVGAWKALVQLFTKPSYWEKTEHGFCLFEDVDGDLESDVGEPSLVGLPSAS
jgi:cellulose synthase/poly-beta-1,6-N-acetylglucosamine synthase-like glycosyltransferase